MRRRKSSFIFGIEDDARDITDHLVGYLNSETRNTHNGIHKYDSPEHSIRRIA
jgi:hypothetical protein